MPTQEKNRWTSVLCVCLITRFTLVYGCLQDNDCRFTTVVVGGNTIKIPQELCCRNVFPPKCIKISDMSSKCYSFPTQTTVRNTASRRTLFPSWPITPRTLKPRRTTKPWPTILFEPLTFQFTYTPSSAYEGSDGMSEGAMYAMIIMIIIIMFPLIMCVRYIKVRHAAAEHNNLAFTGQETQPSHVNENVGGGISMDEPPSYEDIYGPSQSSAIMPPLQFTYNQDSLPQPPKYEDVV